ncbi:hypothetical protein [Kribbella sindirgiensis]|uniref:MucR family transcriptional regulator n=1 Tax=Kribbella sindirgiensis TaxID=1124744 RepID=A0A4R0J042_9ACTN|nr:hypothetical protein [Kribbella sindirgiensis]TCC37298.1 hypothetical protein E0H50_11655 [Kribbella sindirgiensis]
MSSLLRPVGHLPASVYWFRRGLVLAVVVVLVILISRLFAGGGDDTKNAAASDPQPNPTGAAPVTPSTTPSSKPSTTQTQTPKPTKTTPPADLACKGSDLSIDALPANRKIVSGSMLNFVIQFRPIDDGCKATVNADKLTVTVTSGTDQIWSTTQCDKAIQTATLVVAKGKQSAVTVPWNGHRSRPGCLPGQPIAKPGTYVVKAEYDGRSSGAQAFQVV